jgi:VIT1/CCC1 family predicted Fe2+/Mn2+ transporter
VNTTNLDPHLRSLMLSWQKTEITEHYIYRNLARAVRDPNNRAVLEQIAASEAGHAAVFKGFTVMILILPYLILKNYLVCLVWTLVNAILVIAAFNFYIAVVKGLNFARRFLEMALISLGVAAFSFGVGVLIRKFFGLQV